MTTVVIFTPPGDGAMWRAKCAAKLDTLALTVHSTTQDYCTAHRLVDAGVADAILVARHDHIPHGPRVIVAAEVDHDPAGVQTVELRHRYVPPRQRRPHPLDG